MSAVPGITLASYKDDIGYTLLLAELGSATPDGTGITVTHVEACSGSPCAWAPDPTSTKITYGIKSITDGDGGLPVTAPFSAHANNVGKRFYGDAWITPGIGVPPSPSIAAYDAEDWLLGDSLKVRYRGGGQSALPSATPSRIANHSYVASLNSDEGNLEALRRVDWLVETDEYVQVVGFNGNNSPLLSSAFNVIAVDALALASAGGSQIVPGDAAYNVERTRPDLVAPEGSTSSAAPDIASAAAFLMEASQSSPSLSGGSRSNRQGTTILNAERSEVIKAVLMAGASRATSNTFPTSNIVDISDYRSDPADQTVNGLDRRYGAGQLNIHNSYHIIAAGEQGSLEDTGSGVVGTSGFDHDAEFGGSSGSNSNGTYLFSTGASAVEFAASLTWNIAISSGVLAQFNVAATLHNLNLALYDVSDPQNWVLLQESDSTIDNTENIWMLLAGNTNYALQVHATSGPFLWDYGLAWRSTDANLLPGDINDDGKVNVTDLILMKKAVTGQISLSPSETTRADVYPVGGDQNLNISDLLVLEQIAPAP